MIATMSSSTQMLTTQRVLVWMAWRRYLTRVRAGDAAAHEATEQRAWEGR
jgi:hypothetical protein